MFSSLVTGAFNFLCRCVSWIARPVLAVLFVVVFGGVWCGICGDTDTDTDGHRQAWTRVSAWVDVLCYSLDTLRGDVRDVKY